jgi:phage tail-like protein
MDANGTRFHLLLGYDDWARCAVEGVELKDLWSASPPRPDGGGLEWNESGAELTLRSKLLKFVAAPKDVAPSLESRRGAGSDQYGNWYWIDDSKRKIRALSTGSGATSDFWDPAVSARCSCEPDFGDFQPASDPEPVEPPVLSGLCVTEDHYLVVGMLEPAGLLIFDLHAGGEPRELRWPREAPFAPYDMAPRPGGGVWILDQLNRRYWALDHNFNVVVRERDDALLAEAREEDFQPLDAGATRSTKRRTFPRGISLDQSSPLELRQPIAIEALPDGAVLILDYDPATQFSFIYRYEFDLRLDRVSTEAMKTKIETDQESGFNLIGYDMSFVAGREEDGAQTTDRLYVVSAEGNQSFAFDLCLRDGALTLIPVAEFLPMRLFGGKGLVAAGGGAWYDFDDRWIPLIRQRRPRYEAEAVFVTPPFDGREPDCVWHRLVLDSCVPPGTGVKIRSRAADDEIDLELTAWGPEPSLYRRGAGSELPFMPRNDDSPAKGEGSWELLFQRARGRFLQLEIRLTGDERATPRLRALRAYYPRFSYLTNYLPAVYREDAESASFLDRFLANIEGFYTALEDKIAAVQMLFDARSAPAETLEWLANWFGVALDPAWDEAKRRLFIRHAMDFFQARGTARGLKMALRLAFEPCADEKVFEPIDAPTPRSERIRIVEKFLTRRAPGVVFGDPTDPGDSGGLSGLRQVAEAQRWEPSKGRDDLRKRYADFKKRMGRAAGAPVEFPIESPDDPDERDLWRRFSGETLGFVPSSASVAERSLWQVFLANKYGNVAALNAAHMKSYGDFKDVRLPANLPSVDAARADWTQFVTGDQPVPVQRRRWQDFLARRYRRAGAMNQLYNTNWTGFELAPLPETLPADGAPLQDWFQFESLVLPMRAKAHRFAVLLPSPATATFNLDEHQRNMELARRIVELEKPAHTVFEVKFYWAMFRLGESRLGGDTLLDRGSRSPQLMPKMILGGGYLGEGWLAPTTAEGAATRQVIGRDKLGP